METSKDSNRAHDEPHEIAAMSETASTTASEGFPLFMELPLEIRHRIYYFAMEDDFTHVTFEYYNLK